MNHVITLFLLLLTLTTFIQPTKAGGNPGLPGGGAIAGAIGDNDVISTTVNILENLTCETQGIGDLLRSEFSHTCTPAPFFTFAVANIVSPGMYANMMLRLKINDTQLFGVPPDPAYSPPGSSFTGPCDRNNRIDPNNRVLSFALCNNIKLAEATANAVANSAVAIATAMLTGSDPWDSIKDSWNIPESSYHQIYTDQADGASGTMFDIGVIPAFPWKVISQKDQMCVATIGITGWIPVGCKYIKEPYPQSIYSAFTDDASVIASDVTNVVNESGLISTATDPMALTSCSAVGGCFQKAYNVAKAPVVITSPIIECIKEMAARLLIANDVCSVDDIGQVLGSSARESSSLFQFQQNMQRAVTAFLSLYVILYGFKIVLTGDIPPKNEVITFGLKIIFVIYFAIGINVNSSSNNNLDRLDGMVQWALPFLLGGVTQIATWIMDASPSSLCKFAPSEYPTGMGQMAVWDALDCRISNYLGLDLLNTMVAENAARLHDFKHFDGLNFPVPPYLYLLVPAIITGQTTLISLALMFPLLIISVAAYMVNAAVVCLLGIVILGILAPLFVPMILFEYTKGYFESWVKLLISFMLQPMIVAAFIISMFCVYDFAFYGTCQYTFSPVVSDQRTVKVYFVDTNWDNYPSTDAANGCIRSLGYMLNSPRTAQINIGTTVLKDMIKTPPGNSTSSYVAGFPFLQGMNPVSGLFIEAETIVFEIVKEIILALITACIGLYLMYNFSAQLSEFAADLTEGVSLTGATIAPQTIFKYGMKLSMAGKGGGAAKGAGRAAGVGGAKIAGRAGAQTAGKAGAKAAAGAARDKISSHASSTAKDSFSTGGGGGGGSSSDNSNQNNDQATQNRVASSDKGNIGGGLLSGWDNKANKAPNKGQETGNSNSQFKNPTKGLQAPLSTDDLVKSATDKIQGAGTVPISKTIADVVDLAKSAGAPATQRGKSNTAPRKGLNTGISEEKKGGGDAT